MTKAEQLHFVEELCDNVKHEVLKDLTARETPDSWDGIELRMLVRNRFAQVVISNTGSRSRTREFNNYCIVHNL